uniref:Major facilitator superfamily MFS_1 n=1 Tax=Cyanothece sp. (strain PCC 7425 / ATCC 29141) TaxID=395961 RepID=B8HNX6_CYAP4
MENSLEETVFSPVQQSSAPARRMNVLVPQNPLIKLSKDELRSSLRASTLDGIFATIFSNITGGVLLSNFLLELGSTPFQIGMLAAIPMVANLLQPLGAYWADATTSRRSYNLWVYSLSRLLWLPLAIGIIGLSGQPIHHQAMIFVTLGVMLASHLLGAIGSASWLSWLAALVPRQLRGRYFGFRNSTFSLTSLIALPCLGFAVSHWRGGSIQGFGVMVTMAVGAGLLSLGFQSRMTDVNPQTYRSVTFRSTPLRAVASTAKPEDNDSADSSQTTELGNAVFTRAVAIEAEKAHHSIFGNDHFLLFLLYFGIWAFGVNLSNPFFNLYLLDSLALDLRWVTLYNALGAGANLLMLLFWGKLADQIGNRAILLFVGVLVALTPLLWLGTGANSYSIWLWFPLLHLLGGGTMAAIDLCINNLQLAIAPVQHHTKYFAITAAIGGVAGAMGALVGGWLAQFTPATGLTGLFTLSSGLRLLALLPLVWVQEPQRRSLWHTLQRLMQPFRSRVPGVQDGV